MIYHDSQAAPTPHAPMRGSINRRRDVQARPVVIEVGVGWDEGYWSVSR